MCPKPEGWFGMTALPDSGSALLNFYCQLPAPHLCIRPYFHTTASTVRREHARNLTNLVLVASDHDASSEQHGLKDPTLPSTDPQASLAAPPAHLTAAINAITSSDGFNWHDISLLRT